MATGKTHPRAQRPRRRQAGGNAGGGVPGERLARIRRDAMRRKGSWVAGANPYSRDVALWRAWKPGMSVVQVRAALLAELAGLSALAIYPDWSLAGEHLAGHNFGLPGNTTDLPRFSEFGLSAGEQAEAMRTVERWNQSRDLGAGAGEPPADARQEQGEWTSGVVYWASGWIENHSIRDFAKVIRLGFAGIRQDLLARIDSRDVSDPEFIGRENFWKAGLRVCDAGITLGRRYAALASDLAAKSGDRADQARLQRMAAACARVPEHGARTFFEAVQSLWLTHVLSCGEDGINANSIGRLDQILFPYYQADRRAGRLTRAEAVAIMEEFACKLYLEYDVQAITLGGVDAAGKDASNELTEIILDATRNVDFIRDLSVRLHAKSPPHIVRTCAEMVAHGGGIPFFFNDECFIRALVDRGISRADARGYAPIGCIELTIPGRANPHAVSGWFNSTKCLELALFDGVDPQTGVRLGPATGLLTQLSSSGELFDKYMTQVEHFARRMVYCCNRGEILQREHGPLPCWSILTDDCIPRGRDITDGGAVYLYHSVCLLGTANTADSLYAIQRLLFEERRFRAEEILRALRANFVGYEPMRKAFVTAVPKYGNDVPEVDEIAARVCNRFIDLMDTFRSPLGGRYFVHLFSFLCNLAFGKNLGATPDGRRAGEPVAYSLSAHQGRDEKGVTAMLRSLARMPHNRAAGASAAIVDLDPSLVAGAAGVERLACIIEAAVRMGVGQLQMNVTTAERLRLAQQDVERYGNVPVRVAGYSQMFKLVPRELQDHIIARTKHTR